MAKLFTRERFAICLKGLVAFIHVHPDDGPDLTPHICPRRGSRKSGPKMSNPCASKNDPLIHNIVLVAVWQGVGSWATLRGHAKGGRRHPVVFKQGLLSSSTKSNPLASTAHECVTFCQCQSFKRLRRWVTQATVEPPQQKIAETHPDRTEWS